MQVLTSSEPLRINHLPSFPGQRTLAAYSGLSLLEWCLLLCGIMLLMRLWEAVRKLLEAGDSQTKLTHTFVYK